MWKLSLENSSGWYEKNGNVSASGIKLPRYKQLIGLIEGLIKKGQLASGEKLPAERELAILLGLNRSTVIRALEELAERGVVIRKKGSGTYVNPEKWGLQSHELFNWQAPPALQVQKRSSAYSEYSRQVAALREKARRGQRLLLDLSGDHLPEDLQPDLFITEGSLGEFSLRKLISAEQDEEGALLGLRSLREAVHVFLRDMVGLDLPLEQILITSGTQQALFLVTQCLLRPGDAVGVEFPSYFYSLPVFQAAGLRLFALPMDAEGITLEGLDLQHQVRKLKMIFLNPIFHNPTGNSMSPTRRLEILEYCSRNHIPIFEDDAYSLLSFDPGMDTRPIKGADKHHQVIYSGSLSSYAGRSLRAGWMAAPEPVLRRLAEVRLQMDSGLSVLPQLMAARYLDNGFAAHRLRLWESLAGRAAALVRLLKEKWGDHLDFLEPQGGLYLYARMRENPGGAKRKFKQNNGGGEELLMDFLREGVVSAPGLDFGDNGVAFRFNFAHFLS